MTARFGEGDSEYWVFTPAQPQPDEAPLVVFLHGWGGMNPRAYGAWLEHIVRKGHIVVYPRYQANLLTPPEDMTGHAITATVAAWTGLVANGPVRPRSDHIAVVGHSLGGLIAANLAATSRTANLPPVKALMLVEPGGESRIALADLTQVPADALVLLVVGEDDTFVGDRAARLVRDSLTQIPRENIDFVIVRSEHRSVPQLIADHLSPLATLPSFPPTAPEMEEEEVTARAGPARERGFRRLRNPRPPDALDFYGYWKLLDGLLDASFRGMNRDYALGNTQEQRFMGRLSDGTNVVPLLVED